MAANNQYNPKSKPRKADNLDSYQPDNPRVFTEQERRQHIADNEAMYRKEMERISGDED
jgi:hypothetical protein